MIKYKKSVSKNNSCVMADENSDKKPFQVLNEVESFILRQAYQDRGTRCIVVVLL